MLWRKLLFGFTASLILCLLILAKYLFSEYESRRFMDPTGTFTCVVTSPTWERHIPRFPGQGSDASGHLEIFMDKESQGKIPVPMLQFIDDLQWIQNAPDSIPSGAYIKLIGKWDFESKRCFFWARNGHRKMWVKNPLTASEY